MSGSRVVVLKTTPESVVDDYGKLMRQAGYRKAISREIPTMLKLNLSWTKYFPACSSQPWQVHGVVKTMIEDGYPLDMIVPVENRTVVTDPIKGARNNRWMSVLDSHGLKFTPLTDVKWVKHEFREPLLKLDQIFPEGIEIPEMYIGKNVIHLPTVKTHGHSTTTGAIKNSFGGLLKTVRHYAHKYIHEVLVDLLIMQKELHPGIFAVMDGTVCGNGAGPRTMIPVEKDYIIASSDSVAIDSVAAAMMGFEPMTIPYLRMAHERGLGTADLTEIEIQGEDIAGVNFGFTVKRSFVIWGDQLIRKGALQPFEKLLLHSPLVFWAPMASNIYHDYFWYPLVGKGIIRKFNDGKWGRLFDTYR
ncbi:MAG TPA: DUF362 domain-containing protein [Proteobacteria bacterium]|nr:hypothetical protein BMS3Abin14_01848 [bacterium BMS3Abin14]HDL52493.1 DUF362 domain-containing protein [Pseudomonadota bacterium]